MKQTYKSEILGVIHEDAQAMFAAGGISAERMKEYDRGCLTQDSPQTAKSDSSYAASPTPAYTASHR
jgi:DNA-binding transcriptional regulator YiaG